MSRNIVTSIDLPQRLECGKITGVDEKSMQRLAICILWQIKMNSFRHATVPRAVLS